MTPRSDAEREVLEWYSAGFRHCVWHLLEPSGGFSGAAVWRGELDAVPLYALKRWPCAMTEAPLRQIHSWMIQARHFPFVPAVLAAANGHTVVEHAGHVWDISGWKQGEPCRGTPSREMLAAACSAIVQLHDCWKPRIESRGPCPAVARRLKLFEDYESSVPIIGASELRRVAELTVDAAVPAARRELRAWQGRQFPLQPCLADVHREHVLFADGTVSGVIDYGAMKVDNVAADAARYLGDAAGDDPAAFAAGCELFARHHGESSCPAELVAVLHRTGTLGSIAHWLMRRESDARSEARLARLLDLWQRAAAIRP